MNWTPWLELIVRSAVLLLAAEAVCRMARRASARFRHRLLLSTFLLLILMPVLQLALPPMPVIHWRPLAHPRAVVNAVELSARTVDHPQPRAFDWLPFVWPAGLCAALLPLLVGTISVRRMAGRAVPFSADQNIEILITDELPAPVAFGLFRPRILLPAVARNWPEARLKAVLAHEMAHVNRRDLLVQFGVHLITALWWFQPLAWLLRRRLRQESELACDAQAIASGLRPTDYAAELVTLAKAMGRTGRTPGPAIAMFGSCDLEERVRAVLNPPKKRLRAPGITALGMLLGGAAVAAATVTVTSTSNSGGSIMKHTILSALLASAGLSGATVSGSIHDGGSAAVAEAKVTLLNPDTSARQEVVTDSSGKFSFSGSGAGQYILRIEKPGFTSILREFDLQGDSAFDADFTLSAPGEKQTSEAPVSNAPVNGEPPKIVRVGGAAVQNNLLTRIQPVYPAAAKAARIQGRVELQATISKDGVPLELRVTSSPNDDLSQNALEAVRQWRYKPVLLNGNPVEVVTQIRVDYTLSQ